MANRRHSRYAAIENAINRRNNTERLLILIFVLVALGATWKSYCFDPALLQWQTKNARVLAIKKETIEYQESLDQIIKGHQVDRLKPLRIKKNDLLKDVKDLDSEIQKTLDGAVSSEEMRSLLMSVLKDNPNLKVISLANLDDIALSSDAMDKTKEKETDPDAAKEAAKETTSFLFYKHGMRIEFEGDYASTLQYLRQLEGLKYKLVWAAIKYTVTAYPKAKVELTVMTVNDKKGWIGV